MKSTLERAITVYYGVPVGAVFGVWLAQRAIARDAYMICWGLILIGFVFGVVESSRLKRRNGGEA